MKLYRIETRVEGMPEPMVDWYEGETEADAILRWERDRARYGLPADKTTKVVREATEKEYDSFKRSQT